MTKRRKTKPNTLGLLGVPGMRNTIIDAAIAEQDAARAALWAHHIGIASLQRLRAMTLGELADHIHHNTAWDRIEIPSYVIATIAALTPKPRPQQHGGSRVHGVVIDEVKRVAEQQGLTIDPWQEHVIGRSWDAQFREGKDGLPLLESEYGGDNDPIVVDDTEPVPMPRCTCPVDPDGPDRGDMLPSCPVHGWVEPPHDVRSCGCQVNAPHICERYG